MRFGLRRYQNPFINKNIFVFKVPFVGTLNLCLKMPYTEQLTTILGWENVKKLMKNTDFWYSANFSSFWLFSQLLMIGLISGLLLCVNIGYLWTKKDLFWIDIGDLWPLIGKNCQNIVFIQKCLQFSQKLFASNACMQATYSMSVIELAPVELALTDLANWNWDWLKLPQTAKKTIALEFLRNSIFAPLG